MDDRLDAPSRAAELPVVSAAARAGFAAVIALIYPPTCVACGQATGTPQTLCAACWAGMRLIELPFCERLGTPFAVDLGVQLLSPAALAEPPVYERARAVARYDETARALVHRLKYGDQLDLAEALGRMMARAGAELTRDADVIAPVPLHRWRLWRRRFNQAMGLARGGLRPGGALCDPCLLPRCTRTRPQVVLTRTQRGQTLQGAFRVPDDAKPRLAGRR